MGARLRGQHSSSWWIECVVDFAMESCMASLRCSVLPTFLEGWAFEVAGAVCGWKFSGHNCVPSGWLPSVLFQALRRLNG